MQELERNILDVCEREINGLPVSPEEKRAIDLFMKLNENAGIILKASYRNPIILVYFKQITKQERRTGQYYISEQGLFLPIQMIISMLQQLISFPSLPQYQSIHYLNVYLSLIGQILGKYLTLTDDNEILKRYFNFFYQDVQLDIQIKIHSLLKLIRVCLQQIVVQRIQYTELALRRNKVIFFAQKHAKCFIEIITVLFSTVIQNLFHYQQEWKICQNLLSLIESFLEAMNQKGNYYKSVKCLVHEWQAKHLLIWVQKLCFILSSCLNILWSEQIIGQQRLKQIKSVATHSLFVLTAIYQLKFVNSQDFLKRIINQIIKEFLTPFLDNFSNNQIAETNLRTHFYVGQEYNTFVVNLLLTGSKTLLQELINIQQINLFQIIKTKSIECVINYCNFCLEKSKFSFQDFQRCAIGLSIKLLYKLKIFTYEIVNEALQKEERKILGNYLQNQRQQDRIILGRIQQDLQIIYHQFSQKIITNKLFKISSYQLPLYDQGKDWQQFFINQLNQYFMEAATYLPGYLSDSTIYSQLDYKTLNQNSNDEKMNHQPLNSRQIYLSQLVNRFLKQPGFKLVHYIFYNISQQIDKHNLTQSLKDDKQQTNFLCRLIPLLSLLRAIIFHATDSQKKGYFYYQFYKLIFRLKLEQFTEQNQYKVRLCILYILKAFIQECIPCNFGQLGQTSSCTLMYLFNHQVISDELLIRDSIQIITTCLMKVDYETEDQEQIVNFSLNILQYIVKKIIQRINYILDQNKIDNFLIVNPYKQLLQNLKISLVRLPLQSPSSVRKMYSICALIGQIFNMTFFYNTIKDIFSQIKPLKEGEQQKLQNLDLFLSGVTGFLQSLTKTSRFKIAAQLFLTDQTLISQIIEDKSLTQYILPFLLSILSEKLNDSVNNSLMAKFTEVLRPCIDDFIQIWLTNPNLQSEAIQLYKKVANIKQTEFILPLCESFNFDNEIALLNTYFQQIHRIQNIDSLYKYAILKVQWLNSYIQAKLLRDQAITINLQVLAPNIRYQKRSKVQILAKNLSQAIKIPKAQILKSIQKLFDQVDNLLYQPKVKDTDQETFQ